jgi:hypothetical protein
MTQKLVPFLYLEATSPIIDSTTPISTNTIGSPTANASVVSTTSTILGAESLLSKYFSIFGETIGILLLLIVPFMLGLCFYWMYRHRKDAQKQFKRNEQSIIAQNNIDYSHLLRKKETVSTENANNKNNRLAACQQQSVLNSNENSGFNVEINNKIFRLSKGCEKFLLNPQDPRSFGDHLMHCHPDIFNKSSENSFPEPLPFNNI